MLSVVNPSIWESPDGLPREVSTSAPGAVEAKRICLDFAQNSDGLEEHEVAFALARKLRALNVDNPEQFEGAVLAFFEARRWPEDVLWEGFYHTFLDIYVAVKSGDGDDLVSWAVAEAEKLPYPAAAPGRTSDRLFRAVVGVCYHLSTMSKSGQFWFAQARLAECLSARWGVTVRQEYVSRTLGVIEKRSKLISLSERYSRPKDGKAGRTNVYRFVGPGLDALDVKHQQQAAPPSRRRFATERSPDTPYESRHGLGVWFSFCEYLAEKMCRRKAIHDKLHLPDHYWDNPDWSNRFVHQLRLAKALLKKYDQTAISRALDTPDGRRVHSLGAEWFDGLLEAAQRHLETRRAAAEVEAKARTEALARAQAEALAALPAEDRATAEPPRPAQQPARTMLGKLRD